MKLNPFTKSADKVCLLCEAPAGKNPAEVRYKYRDGEGVAYLCKECSDDMNQDTIDKEHKDEFSV